MRFAEVFETGHKTPNADQWITYDLSSWECLNVYGSLSDAVEDFNPASDVAGIIHVSAEGVVLYDLDGNPR